MSASDANQAKKKFLDVHELVLLGESPEVISALAQVPRERFTVADLSGHSVLYNACTSQNTGNTLIRFLLDEKHCDPNVPNIRSKALPQHAVVQSLESCIVRMHGPPPLKRSIPVETQLVKTLLDILQLLKRRQADMSCKNMQSQSALDIFRHFEARMRSCPSVAHLIDGHQGFIAALTSDHLLSVGLPPQVPLLREFTIVLTVDSYDQPMFIRASNYAALLEGIKSHIGDILPWELHVGGGEWVPMSTVDFGDLPESIIIRPPQSDLHLQAPMIGSHSILSDKSIVESASYGAATENASMASALASSAGTQYVAVTGITSFSTLAFTVAKQASSFDADYLDRDEDLDSSGKVGRESLSLSAMSSLRPMNQQGIRDIIQRRLDEGRNSSQPSESVNLMLGMIPSLMKSGLPSVKSLVHPVLFIGDTGSGKSTTVNFLSGQRMEKVDRQDGSDHYDVANPAGESIARIGHSDSNSETLFAEEIIPKGMKDLKFVDCPGFGDSRGFEFDCAHAVNISESLKSGDTRIVIVIDYHTAKSNRGDRVKQLVGEVRKMFPSYPDLEASCMIAITKLPAEQKSRQQAFDTTVQVIQAAWLRDRSSSPPPSLASQHPAPDTQQSSGPPAFVPIHPLDDARFVLDKILALRPMTNASDHFVPILRDGASISLQAVLKDVTSNIETFLKEDCLKHAHDIFFLLSLLDKFASVKLQDAVAAKRDALLVIFDFVTIEQARQIEELSQSDETLKEKQRYREKFSKFEVTCKTFDTMSEGRLLEFFSKLGSTIEKRDHQQQSKEVESVKLRCERLLLELSQQLRSELNDVELKKMLASSCKRYCGDCRDPSQSLISFLRSFAQQPKLHALHPVANVLCEEVELFCGRPRRCEAIYAYPSAAEASKAYDAFSLNACKQLSLVGLQLREAELELIAVKVLNKMDDVLEKLGDPQLCCKIGHDVLSNASKCDLDASEIDVLREFDDFSASHLFQPATSIQSQITKGSVVHVVRPKKKPFHLRLHPDPSTDVVNRVTPAVLYSHSDDFVVLETPKPSTEFIRVKAKNGSCGFVRLCYLVSVHASSVVEECSADERDIEGDIDEQTECSGIPFVSLIGSSDPSVVFTDFKIRLEVESCKKCLRWIMKQKDQFFRHNQHGSVSMWLKSLHAQKHHRDAEFSAIQSELRQAIPTLYDERTVNGWITGHEFTTLSFFFSEAIKLQACVEWCLPDLQVDRFQTQVSKAIEELNVAAGQDVDRYIGSPEFCGKHGITSLISLLDLNREIQQTPLRDRFRRLLENFGIKLQEQIKLLCQCRTHGPNLCNIVLKMMCLNDFLVDVGIPDDFVVDQVQNLLTISPEEIVALAGREMIACAQDESKSVANKAIQMFPQFRSVYVKQYNKRASVNTIDKVLDAMKVHASDRASGSSINASAKGLLHQCHRKVDDVFTEHMKSAIKAGKSQASISLSGRQPSTRSKSVESEVLDVIRTEVGRILQKIIPSWFPFSKPELNFAQCHMDVSALLGNLFAAYSIKGGCSLQDDDRETWLQPHATQIVCILMLLGIGSDDGSHAKNHLAEVGTGEGKSVILGILGLLFALIGRKVDIVCYSPYLLERDEKQFKDLFDFFSTFPNFVRPRYTTILNLQERFAEDAILPDLPKCVQQAAMNSPYSFKGKDDKRNRVLLIDEVDVFFGENFYGEVSASAHIFDDDAAKDLVKHVFDSRATHNSSTIAASIPVLMAHPSAIKFQTLHPRLDLEQHLKQMLRDLTLSDFPTGVAYLGKGQSHVKVMKEVDDIGYTNMATGAVERKVTYRYKTFFAYLFHCRVIKDIDETKNSRRFGILLNCGYQLYSDLPKHCGLLLGVSGTVSQLSPGDLEVLREFQFSSTSLIPSTFKKEQLLQAASNEGFDVSFGSMDKFFADVISKIQRCRSKSSFHRPILVVFKDESAVKHFNDQFRATLPQWQPLPNLLREVDIFNERTRIIARATQEGSVTFVSRSYGRGTDFVSFCEAVNRNGGVHVILTFLPELKSEMVQIKGRTCRQDNKGSFEEIYWKDDLVKCDDGNVRYVSEEDLDIFWKGEGDWEKRRVFLEDRRKEFDRNRTDRMKARLEANRGRTESTTRMVDLAQNPRKLKDAIQIAYSFTFPSVTSSMHTIFILDESGSMTENWSGLQQAFCRYLDTLQSDEESFADLISVIEFDDDARIVAQAISIDDARQLSLSIRGGGTKFAPAISKANDLLKEDASSKTDIILVFMTDGANNDGDTSVEILRDIFHKFDTRNPKFRAIFFGVVQDQPPILTKMVHAVGSDGVLYNANDTMQLERTFVDIAEAMRVSDKSVDRKGSRLQRP